MMKKEINKFDYPPHLLNAWTEANKERNIRKLLQSLISSNKYLVARDTFNYACECNNEAIRIAFFAADIAMLKLKNKFPEDNSVKEAVAAALSCLKSPTEDNKKIAYLRATELLEKAKDYGDLEYLIQSLGVIIFYAASYVSSVLFTRLSMLNAVMFIAGEDKKIWEDIINYACRL